MTVTVRSGGEAKRRYDSRLDTAAASDVLGVWERLYRPLGEGRRSPHKDSDLAWS